MDIVALILSCSVHLDDPLVLAVAEAFSQGNSLAVQNVELGVLDGQDAPLLTLVPRSLSEANATVARVLDAGGTPIVGLLPARREWAALFGKAPLELFEPCTNISITSAMLSQFDYECSGRRDGRFRGTTSSPARSCILDRYGEAVGLDALRPVVMADLSRPGSRIPDDVVAVAPVSAPTGPDSAGRPGGRVLFDLSKPLGLNPMLQMPLTPAPSGFGAVGTATVGPPPRRARGGQKARERIDPKPARPAAPAGFGRRQVR